MPLVAITELSEKYGIHNDVISRCCSLKEISATLIDGRYYLPEDYLDRRVAFREKIILANQRYYFYLAEYFNDFQIARVICMYDLETSVDSWSVWLGSKSGLFSLDYLSKNPTAFRITKRHWVFHRFIRAFDSIIHSYVKKNFDCKIDMVKYFEETRWK